MYKPYAIKLNDGITKIIQGGNFVYTQEDKWSFSGIVIYRYCSGFLLYNTYNKQELMFRNSVLFLGEHI